MAGKDIIYGYGDGTFRPDKYVSRAEYVAMTNRTYKLRSGSTATYFKDVKSGDWFAREVAYAVSAGYISGYPDGTFRPYQYITRQEAAVILASLLGLKPSHTSATLKAFPDGKALPDWARESVAALVERGYLKGDAKGYLQGNRAISRAEVACLLKRLMPLSPTAPVEIPDYISPKDTTPPRNSSSYPQISDVLSHSFEIWIKTNEKGRAYYVVLPWSAAAPDSDQVKAGRNSSGSRIASKMRGSLSLTADTIAIAAVNDLDPDTSYKVYIVAEDADENLQTSPTRLTVTTKTTRAPNFLSGYPSTTNVGSNWLDLLVKADQDGRVYYVVLKNGANVPSSTQVRAGENAWGQTVASHLHGSTRLTAYTRADIFISGLEPATSYDIYVAAEDTAYHLQSSPTRIDVKTNTSADTTPPIFSSGYPLITNIDLTGFTLQLKTNESSQAYYVILPLNAAAPSSAQVKAGKNGLGVKVSSDLRGSLWMSANQVAAASIDSLSPATPYSIYVVAEDTVPNLQTRPTRIEVKTSPLDTLPPVFSSGYPCIDNIALDSFELQVQINENGKAYYLVLDDNAQAPDSEQVKAGQDAFGMPLPEGRRGVFSSLGAEVPATAKISGLTPAAAYDVYVVAQDSASNLQTTPAKLEVNTLADTTAPSWIPGYPRASISKPGIIKLFLQIDEPGCAYYVVLAPGSAAPSPAQVKAGHDTSGNDALARGSLKLEADTEAHTTIPDLDPAADYLIYLVAEDKAANLQADVTQLEVSVE